MFAPLPVPDSGSEKFEVAPQVPGTAREVGWREGLGGGQYRTTTSQHKPRQDSKRQRTTTKKSTARHNTTNHTTTNNRRGHTTTRITPPPQHPSRCTQKHGTDRRAESDKKDNNNNPATSVNTSLFLVNKTENRQPWIARHTQRTLKELPCRTATLRCHCQRLEYLRVVLKLGHIRGRVTHKIESIAVCT